MPLAPRINSTARAATISTLLPPQRRMLASTPPSPSGPVPTPTKIPTTPADPYSQTLTLPDGRVLGFAEFGDPQGIPLLWFHGFPTCRYEAHGADAVARRHGIRILALDRPGFGLSTFQPGRGIADWPADVRAFAAERGLRRFGVLGLSGGGPYALACARLLPREMLTGVGVMAGAPPWQAAGGPGSSMHWSRRLTAWLAVRMPGLLGALMGAFVRVTRWVAMSWPVTRRIDGWLEAQRRKKKPDADTGERVVVERAPVVVAEQRETLLRGLFDGFAQGPRGFVHEARLLSAPSWGFRFEDVAYGPVRVWHGTADVSAPYPMIRWMVERLPHAVLKDCEGDTHYTMGRHLEEILVEMGTMMGRDRGGKESG
ncbi:alpha/beta hydrolase [Xylariomycetidae sp. FL2044]|nr:alpha/beta hydrolase [Xylariomycetidae sp. FL2044]